MVTDREKVGVEEMLGLQEFVWTLKATYHQGRLVYIFIVTDRKSVV